MGEGGGGEVDMIFGTYLAHKFQGFYGWILRYLEIRWLDIGTGVPRPQNKQYYCCSCLCVLSPDVQWQAGGCRVTTVIDTSTVWNEAGLADEKKAQRVLRRTPHP